MESQQVSSYLNKFETEVIVNSKQTEKESEIMENYGLQSSSSSSQKTSMTSISMEPCSNSDELTKLKQSLNKNLVVLLVDFNKRNKFSILAVRYHLMIQSYSGESNL